MNLNQLLKELVSTGWEFWKEENQLYYDAPSEQLTSEVLTKLKTHKASIIKLLQEEPDIFKVYPFSHEINTDQLQTRNDSEVSLITLPKIIPAPKEKFQPFPLTDIQQAYWLGRNQNFDLGNIATHNYIEIDCSKLNLPRLNQAWQKLIEHHDMLKAVVLADGSQQILEQVPTHSIEVLDLSSCSQSEISEQLDIIREQMSHEVLPAEQWPLF